MERVSVIKSIIWLIVIGGLLIVFAERSAIGDWWYLRSYSPPPLIQQLATEADMTAEGRKVFYRAAPQIVTQRSDMLSHCAINDDQVAELGCYVSNDHIYLMSITDPALSNEMIVTAAYEMLHPVYEQMSDSQRKTVDAEMEAIVPSITDQTILDQMQIYAKTEPDARDNELYSILGTEYPTLTPELEANYAQYLGNRAQLVSYHQAFEQTYDGLANQIKQLQLQIDSTKSRMASLKAGGEISQYNDLVPDVNSQVDAYNNDVAIYNRYGNALFGEQSTTSPQ
jgi:hypothetical protein